MVIDRESASLMTVDFRKLISMLTNDIPVAARAERIQQSPAWHIGQVTLRESGNAAALVVCFTKNGAAIRAAALKVKMHNSVPMVFVCRTGKPREIEALLPPDSRVIAFEDLWGIVDGEISPGKSARRILAGWDDEPAANLGGGQSAHAGYFFQSRGKKRIKFNSEAFTLTQWRCDIKGRVFDLPDVVGSELLVRILLRRGETTYADGLLRSMSGEAAEIVADEDLDWIGTGQSQAGSSRFSPDTRHEIIDSRSIAKHVAQIKSLQGEIAECGDNPGLAGERAALEQRVEELAQYLKVNTRMGPNGALLPKTFDYSLKRAGNLVGKHIRTVLNQLKAIDEDLWQHLSNKKILKFGQVCQYDAEEGCKWQTR